MSTPIWSSDVGAVTSTSSVRDSVPRLGRVPAFDGVRAVAVLLVMGYHAGMPGFHGGRAGVDVFFVLSGFLITALLLEEHLGTGGIGLGAFYMRRLLRLYPALLAAIVVGIGLSALRMLVFDSSNDALTATLEATPFALLYSVNIIRALDVSGGGYLGHTWSLAIEEQFYLVWPLVVIVLLSRRASIAPVGRVALACAVASSVARTFMGLGGADSEMLYNATFSHVDGIFAGCALAVAWAVRPERLRLQGWITAATVAAAALVIVRGQHMNEYGFVVVVIATLTLVICLLADRSSRLSTTLSHPALVEIGKRSYGLYLYHWPIFLFIGIDTRPHVLLLGFGASFAAAWLSHALIEQPFLRLKRRWDRTSPRPAIEAA